MPLSKDQTRDLYRKRAKRYDLTLWVFRMLGIRFDRYKRQAVPWLALKPGDTVVDLGCGTGHNFAFLERVVGPEGRVIGVDLTDAMLEKAREQVDAVGWRNVELVQADLIDWPIPFGVAGVLSTLAITLVPEYDAVVQRAASALRPGGRMVIFDLKEPAGWPRWLIRLAAWLNKPFGVSLQLTERHPWESIRRYLREVTFQELYMGALYISVGEAPHPRERPPA